MGQKLRLDVESLEVASCEMGGSDGKVGTVRLMEEVEADARVSRNTTCFTTPCCAPTVTCP